MPRPNLTGEFALIEWIRSTTKSSNRVLIGVGDDCAAVDIKNDAIAVITTDMLLEGTHFDLRKITPYQVGYKSVACSLSDIAAMGCRAIAVVAAIGFPQKICMDFAKELYRGFEASAREFHVAIVGGDITSWEGSLVISVTALGSDDGLKPVRRSGAKVGDTILVTGELGGSILGKHISFTPRLREGYALNKNFDIHAMIDISDGLTADLNHILEESGVGAILHEDRIPISKDARIFAKETGKLPLLHALSDGEDFELLFTTTDDEAETILQSNDFEVAISQIGVITEEQGLFLETTGGTKRIISPMGYEHL